MSAAWLEQRSVYYLVSSVAVALMLSASWQWLPGAPSQPARMRLFMHDVLTGPGATAVVVVNGTGPVVLGGEPPLRFGQVVMIDDSLTEGASPASRPLGRAQGFYAFASMHGPALLLCMNVVLTAGPYSGSTFTVFGRDNIVEPLRELSVVGGTGRFRMATGYVLWRTSSWEVHNNAVLELDVFIYIPAHA
ncbi:dirigent protein 22-like [Lolium rigidum]|uniref:dirigent protein 22-like n=1 Tax=Lolium rigidum TaxID=89674 RepID=UPI001F5DEA46|nr:dirigent protein 22-like [Lolium rigidum]